MKKIIATLLFLTLLLGACSTNPPPTETESTQAPALTEFPTEEATPSENSKQPEVGREAVVSEIENIVSARSTSDEEFAPAIEGIKILAGGGIQTKNDSRARVDLLPEGTIIRVGPNSSFIVPEITIENDEPKTTLALLFGKVYILLNGGSLDVKTPSGVASVRGSLLSVQYNPETNQTRASCLEGHCAVENEEGEEVELTEGESASIDGEGELSEVSEIDQDEIEFWVEENPELIEFLDEIPNPEDYPDFPDEEWYWNEDEQTGEEWYWDESYQNEEWYWNEGDSTGELDNTNDGSTNDDSSAPPTDSPTEPPVEEYPTNPPAEEYPTEYPVEEYPTEPITEP